MSENSRHRAAVIRDLPAPEVAPSTMMGMAEIGWMASTSDLTPSRNSRGGGELVPGMRLAISAATSERCVQKQSSQLHTSPPLLVLTILPSPGSMHG
jgi:hypothetical protein